MNEHLAAIGDFLHELDLAFLGLLAQRRFAAHLRAFLFDEQCEVENAHAHGSESRWHWCFASFGSARIRHDPTLSVSFFVTSSLASCQFLPRVLQPIRYHSAGFTPRSPSAFRDYTTLTTGDGA